MKVSCVYIVLMVLSLQVLLANKGRGQNLDQINVTIGLQNQSIETLFNEIKLQTGLTFAFSSKDMQGVPMVSLARATRSVKSTLDLALVGTALRYEQVDQNVIVSRSASNVLEGPYAAFSIRGKVTNAQGDGMPGVSVYVKGTTRGTTSDAEGIYVIIAEVSDVLVFSFVGFKTQEVNVDARGVIDVGMEDDVASLGEVVVNAGYWTIKDRERTGNISRVTSDEIQKQTISNPLQGLIGRMPGVSIQQTTGVPGGSINIQIRGTNSLRPDGNSPLYIINGVPFTSTPLGSMYSGLITGSGSPLSSLNPADIESIEILKDADATAIYGSRGANGVVLITTKNGKKGKTSIDLNIYQGAGSICNKMNLLNREQYLQMRHEAFENDEASPGSLNPDYDILNWDTTRYTDWQKKLIGGVSKITNIQTTISGGNSNTQFLIGGGYYKEGAVFPGEFADKKYSSKFNILHTSENKRLNISLSASYLIEDNNLLYADLTPYALTLPPVAPAIYDSLGNLNWEDGTWDNPLAILQQKFSSKTNNLIGNGSISYTLIKDLNLKTNFGYTQIDLHETTINPITSFNPSWGVTQGYSSFATNNVQTWIIEPQLNYKRKIGNGTLNIISGLTFQQNQTSSEVLNAEGYTSDALLGTLRGASTITLNSANSTLYKYNALFGRINYELYDRYIINLTGRRDGSSRFGPGKQFANFGAIGLAWIFSNENFLSGIPILSWGKLRASYGTTGSDQIGDYGYYDLWKTSKYSYSGIIGLSPGNLFNPNYAWEVNKKMEVGMEVGILKDKISTAISVYRNRSSNQLVGYPLSRTTGFASILANLPATVQNTGIEIELQTQNIQKQNFTWVSSVNITFPKNKLISYPDLEKSSYKNQYVIGKSLNISKSFHYTGVNKETGIYTFQDVDNNGNSTDNPGDLQALKEISQKYYGGIQNTFTFKGFQLDIFFQFVKQTGLNYLTAFTSQPGSMSNQPTLVLSRWQASGDKTNIQKFTQNVDEAYDAYNSAVSRGDNRISDASFIRLKTLSLSYTIPTNLSQKIKMQKSRIYIQGQNLITITKYKGLDPETRSGLSLPPLRIVTVGIQITL